jgi:hypothetical protein
MGPVGIGHHGARQSHLPWRQSDGSETDDDVVEASTRNQCQISNLETAPRNTLHCGIVPGIGSWR